MTAAPDYISLAKLPGERYRAPTRISARWEIRWQDGFFLLFDHRAQHRVMLDTERELREHLPVWRNARGRVLLAGLGLGCVLRGLLHNAAVEVIELVEIDADLIRFFGPEFAGERVIFHCGDAFAASLPGHFDFAWHDIAASEAEWGTHRRLIARLDHQVSFQGARALRRQAMPAKP